MGDKQEPDESLHTSCLKRSINGQNEKKFDIEKNKRPRLEAGLTTQRSQACPNPKHCQQWSGQFSKGRSVKNAVLPLTPPLSPPKDVVRISNSYTSSNDSSSTTSSPLTKIFFPPRAATYRDRNDESSRQYRALPIPSDFFKMKNQYSDCQYENNDPREPDVNQSASSFLGRNGFSREIFLTKELSYISKFENKAFLTSEDYRSTEVLNESTSSFNDTHSHNLVVRRQSVNVSELLHRSCSVNSTHFEGAENCKEKRFVTATYGKFACVVEGDSQTEDSEISLSSSKAIVLTNGQGVARDSMKTGHRMGQSEGATIVCRINGLLSLPGSCETRYDISVGELKRRIGEPEFLNKVDMISYVRLAKSSARDLLEKYNIRPKHHSRRSRHSVLSKMCEGECKSLSQGIKQIHEQYFPSEWLANKAVVKIVNKAKINPRKLISENVKDIRTTIATLEKMSQLINEYKDEKELVLFDQATHSFGIDNIQNFIFFFTKCLNSQEKVMETYNSILE